MRHHYRHLNSTSSLMKVLSSSHAEISQGYVSIAITRHYRTLRITISSSPPTLLLWSEFSAAVERICEVYYPCCGIYKYQKFVSHMPRVWCRSWMWHLSRTKFIFSITICVLITQSSNTYSLYLFLPMHCTRSTAKFRKAFSAPPKTLNSFAFPTPYPGKHIMVRHTSTLTFIETHLPSPLRR